MKAIKKLIDSEIILKEAKSLDIPVDTFLKWNCLTYIPEIDEYGIKAGQYDHMNSNISLDPKDVKGIDSLLDQLRDKYSVAILLPPPSFKYQAFDRMYSYNWDMPNATESIVVLFNYDCSVCFMYDKIIRDVGRKFKKNIKYIYYTNYVTNYALLCDAAKEQNRYWEMRDRIISSGSTESISSLIEFADSLGMDTVKLMKNMNDKGIMKKHLSNSHNINKMEIYSVPTYIYQNSIYHDIQTLIKGLQVY
jgi:hypothetical protein